MLDEIFILKCVQILFYAHEYLGEDYISVYQPSIRPVSNQTSRFSNLSLTATITNASEEDNKHYV